MDTSISAPSSRVPESLVINLDNVSVSRGNRKILENVSWQVRENQQWVIMGPNGAGKTTLMQVCTGFIHPTTGIATILEKTLGKTDVRDLRNRIGLSSNALNNLLPPKETVFNSVLTAAYGVSGRWRELYDQIDLNRAAILIQNWGLEGLQERTIETLSEGERKRVHIARSLMANPEILILDEPAAGLDVAGREDLISRLAKLASDDRGPCLILVTHHVEEIPPNFTHAMLIADGKVSAIGLIQEVINSEQMSKAFNTPLDIEIGQDRFFARGHQATRGRRARNPHNMDT